MAGRKGRAGKLLGRLRESLKWDASEDERLRPARSLDDEEAQAPRIPSPSGYPLDYAWLHFLRYMKWTDEGVLHRQTVLHVYKHYWMWEIMAEFGKL